MHMLWWMALALGTSIFWWAPHPPMTDLPQHAGQVTLLHDMLLHRSTWAGSMRLNLLTPYLIGYGLALPLSFLFPVAAALKLLLSAAYLAFVGMCVVLRRHWQSDRRLDWLFLVSFFGFACSWGLLTFLVAAPLGLCFVWLCDRHAQRGTGRSASAVASCGLLLLPAHGLVFLFSVGLGWALISMRSARADRLRRSMPIFALLALFAVYFSWAQHMQRGMEFYQPFDFKMDWGVGRLAEIVAYGLTDDTHHHLLVALAALIFTIPLLLGCRVDWSRKAPVLTFAAVIVVMLGVPHFALHTAFLYQRFALFVLPAYAWLFTARTPPDGPPASRPGRSSRQAIGLALLPLLVGSALGLHALQWWRFGQETAAIDGILAELPADRQMLKLIYDRSSPSVQSDTVYLHYPVWYQAERHGLVDFNFAWFPAMVVRFRPDRLSPVQPEFDWQLDRFSRQHYDALGHDYVVVRSLQPMAPSSTSDASCGTDMIARSGEWMVYQARAVCASGATALSRVRGKRSDG